jgi:hypothetical protein
VITEGKQREAFKIPRMRVQEWVEIHLKAFPLPFYASFGLMVAPPLGLSCGTWGKEHDKEDCEFVTIPESNIKPQGTFEGCAFQACNYPFCAARGRHAIKVCPKLNHRCERCLF